MKLDLTRQTFTQTFTLSAIIMLIYWGVFFIDSEIINLADEPSGIMPIGRWLNDIALKNFSIAIAITIALQLFNALYISRIFIRNIVYAKQTHIGSLLFILISISAPATNQEIISQLVTTFSLLALEMVLSIKKRVNSSRNFFLATLLLSIAGLIYLPAASLLLCVVSTVFIYKRFIFKEFIASIGGALIPPFFYSYYLWATENNFMQLMHDISSTTLSTFSPISIDLIKNMNIYNMIFIVVVTIIMIFSLINFIVNLETTRSRTIYSYTLLWVWMGVTMAIFLLFTQTMSTIAPLCAVSASVIISFLLNRFKYRNLTNLIFITLIILTILAIIL